MALQCAAELENKKAIDILLLKLTEVNSYFDYFLIATGNSHIHCKSLAKELNNFIKSQNYIVKNHPDLESGWIAIDCFDLIIHIFTEDTREYYQLEKLWADAEIVQLELS